MNKKLVFIILFMIIFIFFSFIIWSSWQDNKEFSCWGRLNTRIQVSNCQKKSSADIFLSMHNDGTGYLLATGTWSCNDEKQSSVEGMVDFTYLEQGGYNSLFLKDHKTELNNILPALRYNTLKLKKVRLNSADYILTLPNETLMICTED